MDLGALCAGFAVQQVFRQWGPERLWQGAARAAGYSLSTAAFAALAVGGLPVASAWSRHPPSRCS